MANDYYTKSGNPSTSAALASSAVRAEFALIEAAFDLLPDLTSVAGRVVHANAGSTALTTTSGFTMSSGVLTVPSGLTVTSGSLTVTGGTVTTGATTALSLATTGGTQAQVTNTASASRYVTLTGSNGGNPAIGVSAGTLSLSEIVCPSGATITGLSATRASNIPATVDRTSDDGTLISLRQDSNEEGTISVSGTTVSYNAFLGSHWSQLADGSKPDILRGTLMETIDQMCEWPGEENEKLPRCKVSDTAGSTRIYGAFLAWDNEMLEEVVSEAVYAKDEEGHDVLVTPKITRKVPQPTNDMYVAAVGSCVVRVNKYVVVANGDLLESNGDGTARKQADTVVRSSTVAKVIAAVVQDTYPDGSYTVPCIFFNG